MAILSVEADQVRLISWQETAVPATFVGILGGVVLHVVTWTDRKSTRLNSSHFAISYAVFCLKKKKKTIVSKLTRTRLRPSAQTICGETAVCSQSLSECVLSCAYSSRFFLCFCFFFFF